MEQTDLHACRTPARLAFADHMNRFIAGDRAPSFPEGTKMLTGADPALDGPAILFQDVIPGTAPVDVGVLLQNALVFELHKCQRVSAQTFR